MEKLATETCVDYKINAKAEEIKDKSFLLYGGDQLPVNADLNNYTTCGTYSTQSNATAQTFANCPTSFAFTLYVYDALGVARDGVWSYRVQEIVDYQGNSYRRWGQTQASTTWTWYSWGQIHKLVQGGTSFSFGTAAIWVGYLTNGQTQIYFGIPLPETIPTSGLSVSISGNCSIRHTNGQYILNNNTLQSLGSISIVYAENQARICVTMSSALTSFTNNCPITVQSHSIVLTFN